MRVLARLALATVAVGTLALSGCAAGAASAPTPAKVDRVVIDTTSISGLNEVAKVGGFLEKRFGDLGIAVEYTQLGTSSQMLEGIASGKLDFTDIGYSGLPTGAAAGVAFTVIGEASTGGGDVVVTAPDGPATVADLKGKTVAAAKGSSGWALLIRALDQAGIATSELTIVDLKPDEAQNAFLTGQVDAWAIWSGQATGLTSANSRAIVSGESLGLIPGAIASRPAIVANDEVLAAFLGARQDALGWIESDAAGVATKVAADRGVDAARVTTYLGLSGGLNQPIDDATLASYQKIADLFAAEGQIAKKVDIAPLVTKDAFTRAGL